MTVVLNGGQKLVCQIDDMSGSVAVPLLPRQERDKFIGLAVPTLGEKRAETLMEDILNIDGMEKLPNLA